MAEKKKQQYKVKLEILGETWKQEGKTIGAALAKFPLSWEEIRGKGMITVSKGKLKHEMLMGMPTIRRIFINKISRAMWAKRLKLLLESDK